MRAEKEGSNCLAPRLNPTTSARRRLIDCDCLLETVLKVLKNEVIA